MLQRIWKRGSVVAILAVAALAGCSTTEYQQPTDETLKAFENAGPVLPTVKAGAYAGAKPYTGAYKLIVGDVLSIQVAPREGGEAFSTVRTDFTQVGIPCRVSQTGTIRLPFLLDELKVVSLTMVEAEKAITDLYYPKFLKQPPLVYATIREYQTQVATITGFVGKPGRYDQRSDRMTVMSLISDAGGVSQAGTAVLQIKRAKPKAEEQGKVILLTAQFGNTIEDDIPLESGDAVVVASIPINTYTVIGLVRGPGRFDYPPNSPVSLVQAIAMAGGIDWVGDPKFARIYRRDARGQLVSADFQISDGKTLLGAANTLLKPGDVVALEHTERTAARQVLKEMLRTGLGFDISGVFTFGKDVRSGGGGF